MSSRLVIAGFAALIAGGCQPSQPPVPPPPNLAAPATQAATQPSTRPAADALPFSQQEYQRAVEQYLAQRNAAAPSHAPAPAPAAPAIRWVEPAPVDLSLGPRQSSEPPHPAPRGVEAPVRTVSNEPAGRPPVAPSPPPSAPDPLEARLARQVRERPRDPVPQLEYQLLQYLNGRAVPQMDTIASLSAEDREIVAAVVDALVTFRGVAGDGQSPMLADKIRPLADLGQRLRAQGVLRIPVVALCSKVDAFGVYEPLPTSRLAAGREHAVLIYCEVENFLSQLNEKQLWETRLTQEAVLYNSKGQRVWEEKRKTVTDLSRNRRRDFFVWRMAKLPAALPPDRYRFKVTITDEKAQRIAESGADIEIALPAKID